MKSYMLKLGASTILGWLGIFLIVTGIAVCTSCQRVETIHTYSVRLQHDTAVQIQAVCYDEMFAPVGMLFASGVAIDDHTVLTAAHVLHPDGTTLCIYTARMGKSEVILQTGVEDKLHDLGTMYTIGSLGLLYQVDIGPVPELGDRVCYVSSMPTHMRRCGEVQPSHAPPGDLPLDVIVEQGNSGSPVYDSYGRLVGIVVHAGMCMNGQYCSSEISSIDNAELRYLKTGFRE